MNEGRASTRGQGGAAAGGRGKASPRAESEKASPGRGTANPRAEVEKAPSGRGEGTEKRRRPGRRPGTADTRGEILTAARKVFAEKGFDKATIRGIAREAGVDPALVHHYFDSKEGMFVTAMRLPADPTMIVPQLLAGPREEAGERVVRFILTMTADPVAREQILGVLRTAMVNEEAQTMLREFFSTAVLGRLGKSLDVPPLRMETAFSQMAGIVMMRYILRLEPLASVDIEELIALVSPTIQRYLGD